MSRKYCDSVGVISLVLSTCSFLFVEIGVYHVDHTYYLNESVLAFQEAFPYVIGLALPLALLSSIYGIFQRLTTARISLLICMIVIVQWFVL